MRRSGPKKIPSSLTKADYDTLAEFRFALRKFLLFSENAAAEEGLSPQHHQALLAIKGYPGREEVTIGELAIRLQLRHHSVVGLVKRLEAEGLLERASDAQDRRRVMLTLSKRGEAILERLSAAHLDELQRMGPALVDLLSHVVAHKSA